jgi:hypothetical protein
MWVSVNLQYNSSSRNDTVAKEVMVVKFEAALEIVESAMFGKSAPSMRKVAEANGKAMEKYHAGDVVGDTAVYGPLLLF